MRSFAQRLVFLREKRGLKKKDLAEMLNVSAACVSQYEKGLSMPGYDIMLQLARYFNVSVDYLLGNEDSTEKFQLGLPYSKNITYHSLMNACAQVPSKNREALLSVIYALQEPNTK